MRQHTKDQAAWRLQPCMQGHPLGTLTPPIPGQPPTADTILNQGFSDTLQVTFQLHDLRFELIYCWHSKPSNSIKAVAASSATTPLPYVTQADYDSTGRHGPCVEQHSRASDANIG